jgi:hypothetical protein
MLYSLEHNRCIFSCCNLDVLTYGILLRTRIPPFSTRERQFGSWLASVSHLFQSHLGSCSCIYPFAFSLQIASCEAILFNPHTILRSRSPQPTRSGSQPQASYAIGTEICIIQIPEIPERSSAAGFCPTQAVGAWKWNMAKSGPHSGNCQNATLVHGI